LPYRHLTETFEELRGLAMRLRLCWFQKISWQWANFIWIFNRLLMTRSPSFIAV